MSPSTPMVARRRLVGAAGAALLVGAGCGGGTDEGFFPQRMDRQPAAAPLDLPGTATSKPRIAWVLSSGGPRGFVHVGVLKGLTTLGLAPDFIVGASAGALVGTLWASGLSAQELKDRALNLQPWDILRPNLRGGGLLSGAGLATLVNQTLGGRLLQDLQVPVACVAMRLEDSEVVAFTRGDAGLAVQASSAIVGQLAPVRIGAAVYADADLELPLPVRLAHRLGADRVLAVDASAHEDRAPPSAERYREADRRKRAISWRTSTGWGCHGCHDLKLSNRPVRTRTPGGVAGAPPKMEAPYADFGSTLIGGVLMAVESGFRRFKFRRKLCGDF